MLVAAAVVAAVDYVIISPLSVGKNIIVSGGGRREGREAGGRDAGTRTRTRARTHSHTITHRHTEAHAGIQRYT